MNIRSIEIQYEPISNLTFQVNVVCYVYEHGPIDQNISLNWGDGTNSNLNLLSISPVGLPYLKKLFIMGNIHILVLLHFSLVFHINAENHI